MAKAPALSPLETSDREDALTDWLDDHGIADGWQLAPNFVQAGLDVDWLDQVAAAVGEDTLEGAMRWLNYTVETELLMNEIEDSTTRISAPRRRGQAVLPDSTGRPTRSPTCTNCSTAR